MPVEPVLTFDPVTAVLVEPVEPAVPVEPDEAGSDQS
jgi:hypothetical protein